MEPIPKANLEASFQEKQEKHKNVQLITVNKAAYTYLCLLIPADCSYSSPDYPYPNRVLWARAPLTEPRMLVFTPNKD